MHDLREERARGMLGLWVLVAVLVIAHCGGNVALTPDGATLLSLKLTINDEYHRLDDWVEQADTPCQWAGVVCDNSSNVVMLNVSGMNLTGSISSAVGSLKHLVTLRLDYNNFSGPLPQEISRLYSLHVLNVSNNLFSESLPTNMSNLSKLQILDCYNNNMSGQLPIEISSLHGLRHLHLGGNYFEGPIPREYGRIGKNLTYLALAGNSLTGIIPPELGNLTGLKELYMGYYNVFDDGIPPELGRLSNLVRLDLASCGLTGTIPAVLGNLTHLDSVFLQFNALTGSLPPELGDLKSLMSFDVSVNNLTGSIPVSYGNLVSLELMNFFRNQLDGEIPAAIGDLPNLEYFQVWDNFLSGELPERLGSSGYLTYIDVSDNQLTGVLPLDLCLGGKLWSLIVMDNQLSGPIPVGVANCVTLEHVRLSNNRLNGTVPSGMLNLPAATLLQMNGNSFSGPLPTSVYSPLLRVLDLSENLLEGNIPETFGSLIGLQKLHIANNSLIGSIPGQLWQIPGIYEIDLSGNSLTGDIPMSIGNCSMLVRLDLSRNQLTGEIPYQIVDLTVLGALNLSRNHLAGPIPVEIGLIESLTDVDFSYNNLSGPVPTSGQAGYYNESAYIGNPFLCGLNLASCHLRLPSATSPKSVSGNRGLLAWLVGALFSAALLVLLVGMCCFFRRYRYYIIRIFRKEGTVRPWKLTPFQRLDFTAGEVVDCLCEENIIGRGGAGTVYKGEMTNGEMVAVKRLACEAGRGTSSHDHGFSAEIQTLGKIRHRNIVRLLGFCTNNEMNLLVYEYMPNGSLGEFLHGKQSGMLDWTTRYNIAVQAAFGLCYLHHDCSPLIVHRDVKSNNILLDSNLEAHVADFGLAKLFEDSGKSESMSSIAGSYGYIAPEYAYTLKVNEKSDIYSFGVVLLELLTGKRPIEPDFGDGVDIVQWVRTKISSKEGILAILDARIGGSTVPLQEVMLVLRVALLCSSDHPVDRPTMRDVVQMLSDVRPKIRGGSMTDSRELKSEQLAQPSDLLSL